MTMVPNQKRLDEFLVRLCEGYGQLFEFRKAGMATAMHFSELDRKSRAQMYTAYSRFEYEKTDRFLARFPNPPKLEGKRVLDFGCRNGGAVVRYAMLGATEVIGLDVDADMFPPARDLAREFHVADKIDFRVSNDETLPVESGSIDIVLTEDVMEHVRNPETMLRELMRVLKPGGGLYSRFGPMWLHPHGVHLWDVFPGPWTHVLFPERIVCAVRGRQKRDARDAQSYSEVYLNQMTVKRFKDLVRTSGFEIEYLRVAGIYGADALAKLPVIGEYFSSEAETVLRKPG